MKILLGTNNPNKRNEIQRIIDKALPGIYDLLIPSEILPEEMDVEENGETLEDNALIKAKAFFVASGTTTIADDTGLEVFSLNGIPGVHSARFAGLEANDYSNRKKLLEMMRNFNPEDRKARFRTVICYYSNEKVEFIEGTCEGSISLEEMGENGFGYDSIFIPINKNVTFAQMPPDEKNQISHRGIAINKLIEFLKIQDL